VIVAAVAAAVVAVEVVVTRWIVLDGARKRTNFRGLVFRNR
jgi:hypothetical protein